VGAPVFRSGRSIIRSLTAPTWRTAAILAVPLCFGVVFWMQALHGALGTGSDGPLLQSWLRDATIALPVVVGAAWLGFALARRLGRRRLPITALTVSCAVSLVLAFGRPVFTWLLGSGGHAHHHQQQSVAAQVTRDALFALPAALLIAMALLGVGHHVALGMRRRRAPSVRSEPDLGRPALVPAGGPGAALTRKDFVKVGVAGGVALLLPFEWIRSAAADDIASPPATPFQLPLPVPPALTGNAHTITAKAAQSQIFSTGPMTKIWGYNGIAPGPTILAESGQPVTVTFVNGLAGELEFTGEPVFLTTHLHGGHQAPRDDGYPTDSPTTGFTALIPPGGSRSYLYPNFKDLGQGIGENGHPLWYHDHLMDLTGFNVYMGLAGVYLIHDPNEDRFNLPGSGADAMPNHGYGVVDIPLLLQDRIFHADHSLLYPADFSDGVLGDRFMVNGVIQPFLNVTRRKYRFRIYNGSNRRWYNLQLSSGQQFMQVGTEAGLLPQRVDRTTILMAPAERADVVIDFTSAPNIVELQTVPADLPEADVTVSLLQFRVAGAAADNSQVPTTLRPRPALPPADRTRFFRFDRSGGEWTINNERFDPDRPFVTPVLNATEIWTIQNNSGGWVHPIHVHDVPVQVLSRNGKPPPPWERGERDTVPLGHGESVTIKMQFIDFTGTYVFHCHNMEHEDMRMMARMDIVPGPGGGAAGPSDSAVSAAQGPGSATARASLLRHRLLSRKSAKARRRRLTAAKRRRQAARRLARLRRLKH
jgi:spore coat protein A